MYLKNSIPFSALSIPSDKEVLWVKVNIPYKSFVVGSVSNPPKMKITEHLEDCLESVKQKFPKSGIIIQGDLNIHHWLKSHTTDAEGVAQLDRNLAHGLERLVEFDTYIGPYGSSRRDLFLTGYSDSFSVESYHFTSGHVAVTGFGLAYEFQ